MEKYCNNCDKNTEHRFIADVIGDKELKFGVNKCEVCSEEIEETGEF